MVRELTEFQRRVSETISGIQASICEGLESFERDAGSDLRFNRDQWTREGGGGGLTRVLEEGAVLEKGGVNLSTVHGELSEEFAAHLPGSGRTFFATGVSLVIHPRNPHAPTVHANFRFLERGDRSWFGGGADLTPHYYYPQDAEHFHGVWRECCEAHPEVADYEAFRDWCDRYFFIRHRGEHRGVGGIFFDYRYVDPDREAHGDALLAFIRDAGMRFMAAYGPILDRRKDTRYTDAQRTWQLLRRGRYVEFNLVYDRGTVFGLKTGGRIESILMSLPSPVRWDYDVQPSPGTPEARLLEVLHRPVPAGADPE